MQNNLFELEEITPPPALSTSRPPEKPKTGIAAAIPAGYARLKDGPLRDDDLVWDFINERFLRNDSELWNDAKPADADGLVYVIRSVRSAAGPGDRKYTIQR